MCVFHIFMELMFSMVVKWEKMIIEWYSFFCCEVLRLSVFSITFFSLTLSITGISVKFCGFFFVVTDSLTIKLELIHSFDVYCVSAQLLKLFKVWRASNQVNGCTNYFFWFTYPIWTTGDYTFYIVRILSFPKFHFILAKKNIFLGFISTMRRIQILCCVSDLFFIRSVRFHNIYIFSVWKLFLFNSFLRKDKMKFVFFLFFRSSNYSFVCLCHALVTQNACYTTWKSFKLLNALNEHRNIVSLNQKTVCSSLQFLHNRKTLFFCTKVFKQNKKNILFFSLHNLHPIFFSRHNSIVASLKLQKYWNFLLHFRLQTTNSRIIYLLPLYWRSMKSIFSPFFPVRKQKDRRFSFNSVP